MRRTLYIIRSIFLILCIFAGGLIAYSNPDWSAWAVVLVAGLLGVLVILVDLLLKGFSIRGLTAASIGLLAGSVISYLIGSSPFFEPLQRDPDLEALVYLARLVLFCVVSYVCTVIALRGKDEVNLIIPYVRFNQERVESRTAVVDTSALIDGRLVKICEAGWMTYKLVIPQFVLDEINIIADAKDPKRRERGRRGLEVLSELHSIPGLEISIPDSAVEKGAQVEDKMLFLAESMKAHLITTDYNFAKIAELRGVSWLNINELAIALQKDATVGDGLKVDLIKQGKDAGQAVGYLKDGSMVVVSEASALIGETVECTVETIIPTSGGRMIFARLVA